MWIAEHGPAAGDLAGTIGAAARPPFEARGVGATVVEVNPGPSGVAAADIVCRGPAGTVLPALVAALAEGGTV
ncbi:MAG: hypothetical protein DMD36_06455 [Gemmatimonadetes bacterium]|nr:MAG: hypothetical protein DMD36_06455 [Gemmatimonadota bacterium]